jgi:hypothetical protein
MKLDDECNHVTCTVCKADICYFCGEWFVGDSIYDEHFGEGDAGLCPMYSSYEELHDDRAMEAVEQFQARSMT